MQVSLESPELERFINDEVKSGRFPSHQAAIAAAVERMMLEPESLDTDDETVAAIEEAEVRLDRGEGMPLDAAFATPWLPWCSGCRGAAVPALRGAKFCRTLR